MRRAAPPPPGARPGERLLVSAAVLVGAGLMVLAVSRPWVEAVVDDALAGRLPVRASGRQAAPLVAAVALVALAGAVAVVALRAVGRRVAGLLLVLGGAAASAAAVDVIRTPSDAVRAAVSDATGRSGDVVPAAQQTPWPWVAIAGSALVVLGGVVAVVRSRHGAGLSGRYDAPAGVRLSADQPGRRPGGPEPDVAGRTAAVDPWDRLSRGEDPTL